MEKPGVPGRLDQYQLLAQIGQGGMGTVYKALHVRLEKIVALKVLAAERMNNAEALARFQREIKAVGRLNHPNIISATDAREADGIHFLVMEFAEGIDLARLVKQLGPLPVADACEMIRQAALGLHHAHENGLIHRDIKPSNLVLCLDGQVKVLDLGLARLHSRKPGLSEETGLLTVPGQVMGTVDYMAPEQAMDAQAVDIRADNYSLGCTLYHLLAGQPPFSGTQYRHPAQKVAAHLSDPVPSIRERRPEVPPKLAAVLDRMLAKNPADRFATPGQVSEALKPFTAGCGLAGLLRSVDLQPVRTEVNSALAATGTGQREITEDGARGARTHPTPAAGGWAKRRPSRQVLAATAFLLVGAVVGAPIWFLSKGTGVQEKAADNSTHATRAAQAVSTTRADSDSQTQARTIGAQTEPKDQVAKQPAAPAQEKNPAKQQPEATPPVKSSEPADAKLVQQAYGLLKQYCYRCHGIDFKVPGYNVLDRAILVADRGPDETPYVVPGKPDQSYLWQRVGVDGDMPPSGRKPSAAEKQIIKRWIAAGAPFPERPRRPFQDEKAILTAIRDHLRTTEPAARRYQRYFTLTHLANNHKNVTDDEVRLYRAALAKLANSLSWKQALVVPRPIDREETIYNVDLRDLGWDQHELWKEVLKLYPYGLTHNRDAGEGLRSLAQEVYELAGNDLPYIRADWFIATAARPPLYHTLLQLPRHARDLERQLKVDVEKDFLEGKLARAGFLTSGVSKQNRVVDRHDALFGAYWKSYDFQSSEGNGNLVKLPLGPRFADNPFPFQAFEHAGGEIIFNLPNGLQGYLLVNARGERIDEGPIAIVSDAQETAGTPAIVNGLSCMACHKHGVIRFQDKLRGGSALAGDALFKVQQLFRKQEEMNQILDKDEQRFLQALQQAAAPFLKVGEDKGKNIRDFPEPIGAIARLYVKDLGPEEVALELGMEDSKQLQKLIAGNRRLRELGLGPLLEGGTIKRELWSSLEFATSLFHNVARELGLGTPYVAF